MNKGCFSVLSGLFAGLSVYSFIGWVFARKTRTGAKYKLMCFMFTAGLIAVLWMK